MPLLRFTRLSEDKQSALLDAAERRLAEGGTEPVPLSQLLEAMQLPRASAYTYFDGREDLVRAVVARVAARVEGQLGTWKEVNTPDELWQQWATTVQRVLAYLAAHPWTGTIVRTHLVPSQLPAATEWILAAFDNAVVIGMVGDDMPRALLADATLSVLGAVDAWAVEQVQHTGEYPDFALVQRLVSRLWGVK
ncbi:MAG: TetR/AcrR family transcriptional regulator [Propionibacteriaceae bacterium]|nr:TetR/AcrR family transcriptional regulator [Propionibacteriaceae bacterium]